MKKEQAEGLMALAGFTCAWLEQLPDGYCSERRWPWWLAKTEFGCVKFGWRKRVINIEWADTGLDAIDLTKDDVTKDNRIVHAYSYAKALEYLTELRMRLCIRAALAAKQDAAGGEA